MRANEGDGLSMHGGLAFFIEFLKKSGIWEEFDEECPLKNVSPNSPRKSEILGTIVLGELSGHRQYSCITGMLGDGKMGQPSLIFVRPALHVAVSSVLPFYSPHL